MSETCPLCHQTIKCCAYCGGAIHRDPYRTPDGCWAHETCYREVTERGLRRHLRTRAPLEVAPKRPEQLLLPLPEAG